jgi:hypothetical protein
MPINQLEDPADIFMQAQREEEERKRLEAERILAERHEQQRQMMMAGASGAMPDAARMQREGNPIFNPESAKPTPLRKAQVVEMPTYGSMSEAELADLNSPTTGFYRGGPPEIGGPELQYLRDMGGLDASQFFENKTEPITNRRRAALENNGKPKTLLDRKQLAAGNNVVQVPEREADLVRRTQLTDDEAYSEFKQQLAGMAEPTWKSPEEKMEDTHTDMQRKLSGRNTKARRRPIDGPEPLTSSEQANVARRIQAKGQVDELSSLNGRLAGLQGANDRARQKEEAENSQHSAAMAEMRRMQAERKKEAGGVSPIGKAIGGRRLPGTSDGHGREQTIAGARRGFIRDREAARKENVNRAKAAARNGEKFKPTKTGNDKIDQYVGGAVSSVQNTISRQQADLKEKLIAADAASGGKLGYISGMQEKEAAEAAFKAQLQGQKKKSKADQAAAEQERKWQIEDQKRAKKSGRKADKKAEAAKKEERAYQEGLTEKKNEREDSNWEKRKKFEIELEQIRQGGKPNPNLTTAIEGAKDQMQMYPEGTPQHEAARRAYEQGMSSIFNGAGVGNANQNQTPMTLEDLREKALADAAVADASTGESVDESAESLAASVARGVLPIELAVQEAERHGPKTLALMKKLIEEHKIKAAAWNRQNQHVPGTGFR